MHPYATDSPERMRIPLILGGISIALACLVSLIPWRAPWWIDAPSVAAFYGFLYAWFDRRLWRAKWLQKIGLVRVPDLNGEWHGIILSSHDENGRDHDVAVEIKQTWTRLCVLLRAERSRSRSLIAAVHMDEPEGPALVYEYRNEPTNGAVNSMHIHYGTARLTFDGADDSLSGDYYTGRDRETHGMIRVERRRATENQPQEQS